MSISRSSLDSIPTSFATLSVGTPDDSLENKLKAISNAGFQGIELGFPTSNPSPQNTTAKKSKKTTGRISVPQEKK
jgi:tryptophan synthase alpha subunit